MSQEQNEHQEKIGTIINMNEIPLLVKHSFQGDSQASLPVQTHDTIHDDLQYLLNIFEELRSRLNILKQRKNLSVLEIIKRVRLRTGFFKVYESVDRLELLELHNTKLKEKMKDIKKEASGTYQ